MVSDTFARQDKMVNKGGSTVTITKYNGAEGDVSIPAKLNNKPVTSIGGLAFYDCDRLASVTIPNSVTSIGEYALFNCTSLTRVIFTGTIPSSGFQSSAFNQMGDLRDKFYSMNITNGTPGTYTRANGTRETWTKS